MRRSRLFLAATLTVASSAVLVGVPAAASAAPGSNAPINVQLIAMNDFHGRIENTAGADSQQITAPGPAWSYDLTRNYGDRVPDGSVKLNGVTIDPATTYRVVANSFLVGGGDVFTAFKKGSAPTTGPVDVDVLVEYFQAHDPVGPLPANHSTKLAG